MFEFLSSRQWAWKLLWIASLLGIGIILVSSIIADGAAYPLSAMLSNSLGSGPLGPFFKSIGGLAQNDGIFGIVVGGLFSVLSIASIYILKIPTLETRRCRRSLGAITRTT